MEIPWKPYSAKPSVNIRVLCELHNKVRGGLSFCLGRHDEKGWHFFVDGRYNNQDYELLRWLPYDEEE